MRKLIFLLTIVLLSGFNLFASHSAKRELNDTITGKLSFIKNLLENDEWKVADSLTGQRIRELVNYIENSPIDTILTRLEENLRSSDSIFFRPIENIPEQENIEGYITGTQIQKQYEQNERIIRESILLDQIVVPENLFEGMLLKLPLILESNTYRLLEDSIVHLPDSLLTLLNDPKNHRNPLLQQKADSLKKVFLNDARISYNDRLIQAYRDSVSETYRSGVVKTKIDSVNRQYTNVVYSHNRKLMIHYNDSVSKAINTKVAEVLHVLVTFADRIPNNFTIHNLFGDQYDLPLQNGAAWYKWIWLKNHLNDSIGIKVENLDKRNIRVIVDESVNLSRLTAKETMEIKAVKTNRKNGQKLIKVIVKEPVLSPWKFQGNAYAGFTQTYINDYWSQGGNSSASALSTFNYDVKYEKNKLKWESNIDMKLGLVYYIPDSETKTQRNWHKNTDNIEFNSRLGYSAFKKWYYSADVNFKSQLFDGYKNVSDTILLSSLFSPAYLTFSAGMEYKPNKDFGTFVAPISMKTTYVTNPGIDETKFGLNEGDTQRTRIGLVGKLDYVRKLFENVALKTKNSIFVNYGFNNDGEWQFLKLPDFDSETTIDFKVNQFISTQLNIHLVYDKDVESTWTTADNVEMKGTRLQVKEFFTLGISYRL